MRSTGLGRGRSSGGGSTLTAFSGLGGLPAQGHQVFMRLSHLRTAFHGGTGAGTPTAGAGTGRACSGSGAWIARAARGRARTGSQGAAGTGT